MEIVDPANDHAVTRKRDSELGGSDVRRVLSLLEEDGRTGWWTKDLRRSRLRVSPGFSRITGLPSSADLTWADLAQLAHPQDRHALADLRTRMGSQRSAACDVRLLTPEGDFLPVTLSCRAFEGRSGAPTRALGLIRLTDLSSGTQANDEESARLAGLLKSTAAAIWTVRADGHVVGVPEWLALTGQSARDAEGLGWLDAVHPDDRGRAGAAWRTAVEHHTTYNTDYRLRCSDGNYRWFNVRAIPILEASGSIAEWLGVCLEVPGDNRFRTYVASDDGVDMTPAQLRGARAMVDWSVEVLGRESGVSPTTIRRLEKDERVNVPRADNIAAIRRALEAAGIEFFRDRDRAPGVRPASMNRTDAAGT